MAAAAAPKVRHAPPDPTLPKPWKGLIDGATGYLYFWNPETKVTTYERPAADPQPPPQPDIDNRSGGLNINNGERSHQTQGDAGALAAAVAVGLAAPALFAEAPRAYSMLSACLTRPYLYFVINGIIISIAAASRFHKAPELTAEISSPHERTEEYRPKCQIAAPVINRRAEEETVADVISQSIWPPPQQIETKEPQPMISTENGAKAQLDGPRSIIVVPAIHTAADEAAVEVHQVMSPSAIQYRPAAAEVEVRGVISPPIKPTLTKHRAAAEAAAEKPLAHSRIGGHQRRSSKIVDGKALGVAKPKRGETLEGTWKAITYGRAVPLARHLKKSDTAWRRRRRPPRPRPQRR